MTTVLTFGEMMMRMAPCGYKRLAQTLPGTLEVTYAGAEANVAVSIAMLGGRSRFVTALPKNKLAEAGATTLRGLAVDTEHIVWTDSGRMGIYFVETGANQRSSLVVYDREGTAIATTEAAAYCWEKCMAGCGWLHVSGITPALSRQTAEATLAAVQAARKYGLTVSLDLNFRKKLWRWDPECVGRPLAEKTMRTILPFVDVLIANESDCADVLGIVAGSSDTERGVLDIDRYPAVASAVAGQFPNLTHVAITLRESVSATHNNWGAMFYDVAAKKAFFGPTDAEGHYKPYEIRAIVDRVGGGDAFAAGLIYAMTSDDYASPEKAIRFAAASSCLAHSVYGDFNYTSRSEVESLLAGNGSGRVQR
ncbi:MAG: sugar kinase [Planctomycetia bacterium]|nr:sugar kinase [Planctomycetia bacterium]